MKYQILITICLLLLISCKKEENNNNGSLRIKKISLSSIDESGVLTFEYGDGLITVKDHETYNGSEEYFSKEFIYYNSNNKVIKIEDFYSEDNIDFILSNNAIINYYSNKIIIVSNYVYGKGGGSERDSLVYNLNQDGKIISFNEYEWPDWSSAYIDMHLNCSITWEGNNVISMQYNDKDVANCTYEYDLSKKNPVSYIVNGIPWYFELEGLILMEASENLCTQSSEVETDLETQQVVYWENREYDNLQFNSEGYPVSGESLYTSNEGNYSFDFAIEYE